MDTLSVTESVKLFDSGDHIIVAVLGGVYLRDYDDWCRHLDAHDVSHGKT